MGIVASFMDRRIGAELNERGVVVWYDPACAWQPWIETAHGKRPQGEAAVAAKVTLGGRDAHLVVSTGSHYEVLQTCEPLVSSSEAPRLLVYVPGEPYFEMLSPLRELECLGGEKEPYQRELAQVARQAFQSAGLSESKIDELLNRTGLDFAYLDSVSVGDGGASPLAPVFGSSREVDVFPSFLADSERRAEAASRGLLPEVARLASQGLGLQLSARFTNDQGEKGEAMAAELTRALLVGEMRGDLDGPEPVAISQIAAPRSAEQVERVRSVCRKLRIEYPDIYEVLADTVENQLKLADAGIDATTLGRIDTFRFEERRLLEACAQLLVAGQAGRALGIVQERSSSFWTSVARYPGRYAEWQACGELAHLALETERVSKEIKVTPAVASRWIAAYAAADGWHLLDHRHRKARHFLSAAQDSSALESGAAHVCDRYDRVLDRMAEGFVAVLKESGWETPGLLRQTQVYESRIAGSAERTAYLLIDALRFEMGADLSHQLLPMGATSLRLEPAVAAAPSITPVGMAALLPGASGLPRASALLIAVALVAPGWMAVAQEAPAPGTTAPTAPAPESQNPTPVLEEAAAPAAAVALAVTPTREAPFERNLPAPLRRVGLLELRLWQWMALPILLFVALVLATVVATFVRKALRPAVARTETPIDDALLRGIRGPFLFAFTIMFFAAGLPVLALADPVHVFLRGLLKGLAVLRRCHGPPCA